ncbi:membrane protein [Streptomyces spiroverticillatus]|uniref:Membrane protein n=1 Tax=Streptomyces finlayi TaxID=67296 RepID=A0A918X2H2_9ACTN|nr:CAP domain-containing protein [Streptomyces finlayi]GHA25001.1 membrane protein [Streptomyces spiroverticillatus]GHD05617.1 membrane protein [Streptomyces finlayi]
MGRHRRTAAGPAAEEFADGTAGGNHGGDRRKKRPAPVRTGLLGVSAAMAFGAVAVASGILPGGDNYSLGGSGNSAGDHVTAGGAVDLKAQGGADASPTDRASAPASARGQERPQGPSKTPAPERPALPEAHKADDADSQKQTKPDEAKKDAAKAPESATPQRTEKTPAAEAPATPQLRKAPASANDAAAAVLSLVNQERAKVGCSPVRPDTGLATLAANFSRDMAARGFFDHTDPDGATPWDRAAKAGIKNLGGENIARGQADAQAVMDAWMKSEGHRKNILNCEYTTLGVGVHMAEGGPWWTQDFGF